MSRGADAATEKCLHNLKLLKIQCNFIDVHGDFFCSPGNSIFARLVMGTSFFASPAIVRIRIHNVQV